jgi:hypothetical protein
MFLTDTSIYPSKKVCQGGPLFDQFFLFQEKLIIGTVTRGISQSIRFPRFSCKQIARGREKRSSKNGSKDAEREQITRKLFLSFGEVFVSLPIFETLRVGRISIRYYVIQEYLKKEERLLSKKGRQFVKDRVK